MQFLKKITGFGKPEEENDQGFIPQGVDLKFSSFSQNQTGSYDNKIIQQNYFQSDNVQEEHLSKPLQSQQINWHSSSSGPSNINQTNQQEQSIQQKNINNNNQYQQQNQQYQPVQFQQTPSQKQKFSSPNSINNVSDTNNKNKRKPGGGWDDDDNDEKQQKQKINVKPNNNNFNQTPYTVSDNQIIKPNILSNNNNEQKAINENPKNINLPANDQTKNNLNNSNIDNTNASKPPKNASFLKKFKEKNNKSQEEDIIINQNPYVLLDLQQIQENPNFLKENRFIQNTIFTGGVRHKLSQEEMDTCQKISNDCSVQALGSLLIYKLLENLTVHEKIKNVYLINYLSQINQKFKDFFNINVQIIQQASTPANDSNEIVHKEIISLIDYLKSSDQKKNSFHQLEDPISHKTNFVFKQNADLLQLSQQEQNQINQQQQQIQFPEINTQSQNHPNNPSDKFPFLKGIRKSSNSTTSNLIDITSDQELQISFQRKNSSNSGRKNSQRETFDIINSTNDHNQQYQQTQTNNLDVMKLYNNQAQIQNPPQQYSYNQQNNNIYSSYPIANNPVLINQNNQNIRNQNFNYQQNVQAVNNSTFSLYNQQQPNQQLYQQPQQYFNNIIKPINNINSIEKDTFDQNDTNSFQLEKIPDEKKKKIEEIQKAFDFINI